MWKSGNQEQIACSVGHPQGLQGHREGPGAGLQIAREGAAAGEGGLRRLGAPLPLALQLPSASLSPLLHSAAAGVSQIYFSQNTAAVYGPTARVPLNSRGHHSHHNLGSDDDPAQKKSSLGCMGVEGAPGEGH